MGADGNPRLRESQLKNISGDTFGKVVALREQRVAADNAVTDAKLRLEKLEKVRGTLEKMHVVIQYGERAVLCELRRCGVTGRVLTAGGESKPTLSTNALQAEKKK